MTCPGDMTWQHVSAWGEARIFHVRLWASLRMMWHVLCLTFFGFKAKRFECAGYHSRTWVSEDRKKAIALSNRERRSWELTPHYIKNFDCRVAKDSNHEIAKIGLVRALLLVKKTISMLFNTWMRDKTSWFLSRGGSNQFVMSSLCVPWP